MNDKRKEREKSRIVEGILAFYIRGEGLFRRTIALSRTINVGDIRQAD